MAAVPDETASAWRAPVCSEKRRSSSAARGPLVNHPERSVSATASISSSSTAGGWNERNVSRMARAAGLGDDLGIGRYELYELGGAVGAGKGILPGVAGREDEAGAIGAPSERPERPSRPAVDPHVDDALLPPCVLEPADV